MGAVLLFNGVGESGVEQQTQTMTDSVLQSSLSIKIHRGGT